MAADEQKIGQLRDLLIPRRTDDEIRDALIANQWDLDDAAFFLFIDQLHQGDRYQDKHEEEVPTPKDHEDQTNPSAQQPEMSLAVIQKPAKKKPAKARKRKPKPSVPDATPESVGYGTPQPPKAPAPNAAFDPTDENIISILNAKRRFRTVDSDMVNKANLYRDRPHVLVTRLHQFSVNGSPHFLVYTKGRLIAKKKTEANFLDGGFKKQRRRREVGEEDGPVLGYWTPHGRRDVVINANREVIGSKLCLRFDDGHLRKRTSGKQSSVWQMIEYRMECNKTNQRREDMLKYTICRLYQDPCSLQAQEYKKFEIQNATKNLMTDDLYASQRGLGPDYREVIFEREKDDAALNKDVMYTDIMGSPASSKFSFSLMDDGEFSRDMKMEPMRKRRRGSSYTFYDVPLDIPRKTLHLWKKFKKMEDEKSMWATTAKEFLKEEEVQVFSSCSAYNFTPDIGKAFMAVLLKDGCKGWLGLEHVSTWMKMLMMEYRSEEEAKGHEARWTILPPTFDYSFLAPDKYKEGIRENTSDDEDKYELPELPKDEGRYVRDHRWPKLWDVDWVYIPVIRYSHWYLAKLCLKDFKITIYNSYPGHKMTNLKKRITRRWEKKLHLYLNRIEYWKGANREEPEALGITVEVAKNVPKQGNGDDCGVMVCRNLEMLVKGEEIREEGISGLKIAETYREYMAETIYNTRCRSWECSQFVDICSLS